MSPFAGEDFQMFEKDLPGQNTSGLNFQEGSAHLPLETCETMNDSWGFNITDGNYKSVKGLVQYLVKAAGYNANFLLNVGPMPDGNIQKEFADTLNAIGRWMQQNGETIYGTRGNIIKPQQWGTLTVKNKTVYVHILNRPEQPGYIFIPGLTEKIAKGFLFNGKKEVKLKQVPEGTFIYLDGVVPDDIDTIIQLELK
jgi:alpha-L-fucosidase